VGQAIECVLAQTAPAQEIIVVDDGSTDDLENVVAPYADRVRFVRIPHGGLSAARNAGVAIASGEFIALLDVDDAFEPRYLEALGELSATYPELDILTTDSIYERDGMPTWRFYERNEFPPDDQRRAILEGCFLTSKTAVRRRAYLDVGGCDSETDGSEDWSLWARVVLNGGQVGLVDAPLSRYRLHGEQMSSHRAWSLAARLIAAEKLAALDGLPEADRVVLERYLCRLRPRVAIAAARESTRAPGKRRGWLRLVMQPRLPWRVRLRGLIGGLAPSIAARLPEP
jgi:glycosyltransferase involved in cell wall biosynthesis